MKNRIYAKLMALVLAASSAFAMMAVSFDAEARRIGGGFSAGRQSSNVMQQRQATPAPAAAPKAGATNPATATPARSGASRWLGPLAGIAAGLGLAALLSHFGLSGAFADLLVIALLAGLALFAIRFFMRGMRPGAPAQAGAQAAGAMSRQSFEMPGLGRDQGHAFGSASGGTSQGMSEPVVGSWFIPAGFDQMAFIEEAKKQFVAIQKAWDGADRKVLRELMTDDLYEEFAKQLDQRTKENRTDVVMLNGELLGIEKLADGYLASVRFSGMIREDDNTEASSFEEVWNLYKQGSQGWLLAGIQQMSGSVH